MEATLPQSSADAEVVPASLADVQPIALTGRIELDQLLRMQRLTARIFRPVSPNILAVLFAIVVGLSAMALWSSKANAAQWVGVLGELLFVGLLTFGFLLAKPRFDAWMLRRRYRRGQLRPERVAWTISADGVEMISDNFETRDTWSQLRFVTEAEDMLVVGNRGSNRLHCLPREFAAEEEWNRLRALVHSQLAKC